MERSGRVIAMMTMITNSDRPQIKNEGREAPPLALYLHEAKPQRHKDTKKEQRKIEATMHDEQRKQFFFCLLLFFVPWCFDGESC